MAGLLIWSVCLFVCLWGFGGFILGWGGGGMEGFDKITENFSRWRAFWRKWFRVACFCPLKRSTPSIKIVCAPRGMNQ